MIRWHYEQRERLNDFELAAVERNVVEWALGKMQIERRPTNFSEVMEAAAS